MFCSNCSILLPSIRRLGLRMASSSNYVSRVRLFDYWQQNDHALEAEFEQSKAVVMIDKEPLVKKDGHSMELVQFETADLRTKLNLYGLDLHPEINSCLLGLAEPSIEHNDYRPIFGIAIRTMEPPVDSGIDARQLRRQLSSELGGRFENLRMAMLSLTSEEDRFLLARFQALTRWYMIFRRCPTCTSPLRLRVSKCAARCIRCERDYYPTLSPVAICLVRDEANERCLLVRHQSSVPTVYTNVAGFASLGETLEETVRREVAEEVGIEVQDIRSVNLSQPWPMPFSSLMVGFTAIGDPNHSLDICRDELEAAQWFEREEVRAAYEKTEADPMLKEPLKWIRQLQAGNSLDVDPSSLLYIPPKGAIAHQMIKRWLFES
ncbi:hypothetical protein M3Y94_00989200 [Aphelenchoides besseyi]|nr:hypothetical protein M3Y94_00989200 [Aphelenchoides besseyi]